MRALAIAATGMNAQQTNVEVIANNIANINTTGFKRSRAEFTDLLYQAERAAGTPNRGGQEAVPWEMVRFALGQTYDFFPPFGGKPFGNVTGELTLQPNQHLRFRGNAGLDVYGQGFQSVNTDVSAMIQDVTATAGTRFDHSAKIEFVTGQIQAKLTRNLNAHGSINYDVQSGTPVEMRFGLDVLCQCASITVEYVRREGSGLARNENEVHFSVNLLGLGRLGTKAGLGAIQ